MLSVQGVHKSFGSIRAVRGVSFEVRPGQVVGLLGPNGAGKTTTIRMITGFLPPDDGRVMIGDLDVSRDSAGARAKIGYLPESAPHYPEMKVREFIAHRAALFGVARQGRERAVGEAMERCQLGAVASRRVGVLSKGFKQRVGLAAAIVHGPSVLVLDEPTNGLDPTQVREARSLIKDLAKDRTLLFSSHVLSEVERVCDRVVMIAGGELRADGTPGDLVEKTSLTPVHVIECARTPDPLPILRKVEGVADAKLEALADEGWVRVRITPRAGHRDLREALAAAARGAGLAVRELSIDRPSLERLFAELIERPGAVGVGGGA